MTGTFVSDDGTRLAYRTFGSGPLLVCVPGGPGRAPAYLEDLGGLDRHHTLLMLDTRGTGGSDLPVDDRSYDAESHARDVDALRRHLGADTLRLLGHSAGGPIAMAWAAMAPERVDRLVLVTTGLPFGDARPLVEAAMAARAGEPWYVEAREAYEGMSFAPPGERRRLERMLRPFWYARWGAREQAHAASADGQTSPRASSRFTVLTGEADLRRQLSLVTAPVLVVGGRLDGLVPARLGSLVAQAFPAARYVELPDAGHFPWVDDPAGFAAAVRDFLGR